MTRPRGAAWRGSEFGPWVRTVNRRRILIEQRPGGFFVWLGDNLMSSGMYGSLAGAKRAGVRLTRPATRAAGKGPR